MHRKEAIRLVIWDLDETFWRGTLTEGGIKEYVQAHHDLVIELAKRGIVSSICSKNNHQEIEKILTDKQLWPYFIFPSIDWSAKGPRLKQIVEDMQLRPETILFIDDNPGNRAEAAVHVPGLQIADETIIPTLLDDPLFKGKDDSKLTRLQQYQLLQRRKADAKAAPDNTQFLRDSNIRVTIEPNVSAHLDRAVELINRTNQLNFTKSRLPEELDAAKAALSKLLGNYFIQAGLVHVQDNYGDYGYCGIYILFSMHEERRLVHFCFSCRILGMSVEKWIYDKLNQPIIKVSGEVLTDLSKTLNVDWINQHYQNALIFSDQANLSSEQHNVQPHIAEELRLQGGCELDALSHYLQQVAHKVWMRSNYVHGGLLNRLDMSTNMCLGLLRNDAQFLQEINFLGFKAEDFNESFFTDAKPNTVFVLSAWGDMYLPVYQHKTLDFRIGLALRMPGIHNMIGVSTEELEEFLSRTDLNDADKNEVRQVMQHLNTNYQFVGRPTIEILQLYWSMILAKIPAHCQVIALLPNSQRKADTRYAQAYHAAIHQLALKHKNLATVDVTTLVKWEDSIQDGALDHLDRMAYYKAYQAIIEIVKPQANSGSSSKTGTQDNSSGNPLDLMKNL